MRARSRTEQVVREVLGTHLTRRTDGVCSAGIGRVGHLSHVKESREEDGLIVSERWIRATS